MAKAMHEKDERALRLMSKGLSLKHAAAAANRPEKYLHALAVREGYLEPIEISGAELYNRIHRDKDVSLDDLAYMLNTPRASLSEQLKKFKSAKAAHRRSRERKRLAEAHVSVELGVTNFKKLQFPVSCLVGLSQNWSGRTDIKTRKTL